MTGSFYKQNTLPDLISGEQEPPLPATIGPYKIESLFSKGGMSLLYLGLSPETKKALIVRNVFRTMRAHLRKSMTCDHDSSLHLDVL